MQLPHIFTKVFSGIAWLGIRNVEGRSVLISYLKRFFQDVCKIWFIYLLVFTSLELSKGKMQEEIFCIGYWTLHELNKFALCYRQG